MVSVWEQVIGGSATYLIEWNSASQEALGVRCPNIATFESQTAQNSRCATIAIQIFKLRVAWEKSQNYCNELWRIMFPPKNASFLRSGIVT